MMECSATQEAVEEQEESGEIGCPLCGRDASVHLNERAPMTDHPTTEGRPAGRCWCGHVRVTHRPWAAGEFCARLTCGCRHYAEKRRGGEVIENRADAPAEWRALVAAVQEVG